jgi:hypothetical protein
MRTAFLGIVVLIGVVAAGCGSSARKAATPVSSHIRPAPRAFVTRNATQASGTPVIVAGKTGVSLRPVPGGTFGLLVVLKNRTHRQLMLEDVQAVVPDGSFVHQLGTHLAPFFQCKPYCSRHMVMKGPFGVERPAAIHVRPLTSAQAQLNFAVAGCGALRSASKAPITRAVVVYRDPLGAVFRQTVALRSAQLDLQAAGRIACRA